LSYASKDKLREGFNKFKLITRETFNKLNNQPIDVEAGDIEMHALN